MTTRRELTEADRKALAMIQEAMLAEIERQTGQPVPKAARGIISAISELTLPKILADVPPPTDHDLAAMRVRSSSTRNERRK